MSKLFRKNKVSFRIFLENGAVKTFSEPPDIEARSLGMRIAKKVREIRNPHKYALYLVAPAFERYLEDSEKPFAIAKSLTSKNILDCQSVLHYLPGDRSKIKVKISIGGRTTLSEFELKIESSVKDLLVLIGQQEHATKIDLTRVIQRSDGGKSEVLPPRHKIRDIIVGWHKMSERYSLFYENDNRTVIVGMEKFFASLDGINYTNKRPQEILELVHSLIVQGNTQYLTNQGFFTGSPITMTKISQNIKILRTLREQMTEEQSLLTTFLTEVESSINGVITSYLNESIPELGRELGIKRFNSYVLDNLVQQFEKIMNRMSEEKQETGIKLIQKLEHLQSMRDSAGRNGVIFMIKQDLGAWFFNNKDMVEQINLDLQNNHPFSFTCSPLKQGILQTSNEGGDFEFTFTSLTPYFIYLFRNPSSKNSMEDIVTSSNEIVTYPLDGLRINVYISSENIDSSTHFELLFAQHKIICRTQNLEEKNEWIQLILLFQLKLNKSGSSIHVSKINQRSKYEYSITYKGTVSEDLLKIGIRAYNRNWKIERTIKQIRNLKPDTNLILPTIPEIERTEIKPGDSTRWGTQLAPSELRLRAAEAFTSELLSHVLMNQNILILRFFEINDIFKVINSNDLEFVRIMAENDHECLNLFNDEGITPLHLAATKSLEITKILIDCGADINILDSNGKTSLHYAVESNQTEIFKYFMSFTSLKFDISDNDNLTPLLDALKFGRRQFAATLISLGADINRQETSTGKSALHYAFESGDIELLEVLIEKGIRLDNQDGEGNTVLILSTQHLNVVQKLIESGADSNIINKSGRTALHTAVEQGDPAVVSCLLKNGRADPNVQDKESISPFLLSVENIDVFTLIAENGGDPNLIDSEGFTITHKLVLLKKREFLQILLSNRISLEVDIKNKQGVALIHTAVTQSPETLDIILSQMHPEVNTQDSHGRTPLHYSALSDPQIVTSLLSSGAKAEVADKEGITPLHLATQNGDMEVMRALLSRGASCDSINSSGQSPIHLAATLGISKGVVLLAEAGADVSLQDKDGNTPLHLALMNGKTRTAVLLAQHGSFLKMINERGQSPLDIAGSKQVRKMLEEASERYSSIGHKQGSGLLSSRDSLSEVDINSQNIQKRQDKQFTKLTYHGKKLISTRIPTMTLFQGSISDMLNYAKELIGFEFLNKEFTLIYEDRDGDFVLINDESSIDEPVQFAINIHIWDSNEFWNQLAN